jgi:hypothetical protein
MIKKLLTAGLLLSNLALLEAQENSILPGRVQAQVEKRANTTMYQTSGKSATINVPDTLNYFYWKHFLRNTPANANSFFTVPCPISSTVVGSGTINAAHGVVFQNPSNTSITVSGAEVLVLRAAGSSTSTPIAITLYTMTGGVISGSVATATTAVTNPTALVFEGVLFTPPVVVTGDYFIAYAPVNPAIDTIRVGLTSAWTATSSQSNNLKFGESLGFRKTGSSWFSNTNYYNTTPAGSDLEAIVIPYVDFAYTATAIASAPNATATPGAYCANLPVSFTNTTNGIVENRQYNFNKFVKVWGPTWSNTVTVPAADSIYNWSFSGPSTPTAAVTTKNASHTYSQVANANITLNVKYQKGSCVACNSGTKLQDQKVWTYTVANCNVQGIADLSADPLSNVSLYPNPVVSGKATISGLEGANTISVHNLLGQVILTQKTDKDVVSIDMSNQAQGTYLFRITDSSNRTKIIKVINQ